MAAFHALREGGAAAGDVKFWAPHADFFDSPRAYSLVISALLERHDFLPSMALLIHWLGNASEIGLRQGGNSLPRLAERWLMKLRGQFTEEPSDVAVPAGCEATEIWPLARKCFDFLEANAEDFWSAPRFELSDSAAPPRDWDRELSGEEFGDDESRLDNAMGRADDSSWAKRLGYKVPDNVDKTLASITQDMVAKHVGPAYWWMRADDKGFVTRSAVLAPAGGEDGTAKP